MKEPQDEYYLLIPHPITGEDIEFDLEKSSNIGLILRLIRKRKSYIDSLRKGIEELNNLRDQHNIPSIEKTSEKIIEDLSNISKEDFESEEEYDKKIEELEGRLEAVTKSFPQRAVDLQNEMTDLNIKVDDLGIKICSLIINPSNGTPEEYDNKQDYISEIIADESTVEDIITFFFSVYPSITESHKGSAIRLKSRRAT